MTTLEDLAMVHVIEVMAPDRASVLTGSMLYFLGKGTRPGVSVEVDWSLFLERAQAEIDEAYSAALAERVAEEEAEQRSRLRSEQTKAGLERRRQAGLPVGRQPGAKDKRRRRRAGYVARYDREIRGAK